MNVGRKRGPSDISNNAATMVGLFFAAELKMTTFCILSKRVANDFAALIKFVIATCSFTIAACCAKR